MRFNLVKARIEEPYHRISSITEIVVTAGDIYLVTLELITQQMSAIFVGTLIMAPAEAAVITVVSFIE